MKIVDISAVPECEAFKYFREEEVPTYNSKLARMHAEKIVEKDDLRLYSQLLQIVKNEELAAKLVDVKPLTPELVKYMLSHYESNADVEKILEVLKKKK